MNERIAHIKLALLGMDERPLAEPGTAAVITDMRRDVNGNWRDAGGYGSLFEFDSQNGTFAAVDEVCSITYFARAGGAQPFLVWEQRATGGTTLSLVAFNGSTRSVDTIETGRTWLDVPWAGTQYFSDAGWLYAINGFDTPIRWNGHRKVRVGFDALPARPSVENSLRYLTGPPSPAGVGSTTPSSEWRYGWGVTLINDRGMESPMSPLAWLNDEQEAEAVIAPDTMVRALPRVEVADHEEHVVAWRLWRTSNTAGVSAAGEQGHTLYFHSEHFGRKGTILLDTKPDEELGPSYVPEDHGLWPRGAKYGCLYQGRLYLSGDPAYPNRVWFSAPGFIEQIPMGNYYDLGTRGAGEARGFYATRNSLVILQTRGIYFAQDAGSEDGPRFYTLTEDEGAASSAVCEVPGIGLLYLADDGVHVLKGTLDSGVPTTTERIGRPIQDTWDMRVNRTALVAARGAVYRRDREVWFQVPTGGRSRQDLGLVMSFDGQWSLRDDWPIACLVEGRDRNGYLYFGSWDTGHRGVFIYSPGFADKDGDTKAWQYRTSWMHHGDPWKRKKIRSVEWLLTAYGERSLVVDHRGDGRDGWNREDTVLTIDSEITHDLWGTATWGSGVWTDYPTTRVPHPIGSDDDNAFLLQVRLTGSGKVCLTGLDVLVDVDDMDIRQEDQALPSPRR